MIPREMQINYDNRNSTVLGKQDRKLPGFKTRIGIFFDAFSILGKESVKIGKVIGHMSTEEEWDFNL